MARGETVTVPLSQPPPQRVYGKTLPCYVILVHGVNDAGEAYPPQEKGLCWGLAERLGRAYDLKPYAYRAPRADRSDPLEPVPDRIYAHRVAESGSHSPVIPFYWGFREEEARIDKAGRHGEWLDACGNRLDKDGARNGGPFPNACNCLPHLWAGGWKPDAQARLADRFSSPTHPLDHRAPDRRYQVLAALRLAMLIRILRRRHPRIAIDVVAHSMGCLVALLAQVLLMDEGHPPADCLVLNNPPYSLEENRADDRLFGGLNQTSRARIETLRRIVAAFHAARARTPGWDQVAAQAWATGLAWEPWAAGNKLDRHTGRPVPYADRDHRGGIHLYFTPHDRTVALVNTRGIGWQGVPDQFTAQGLEDPGDGAAVARQTWAHLLEDLEAHGFRQRLFMRQKRQGEPYLVGRPRHRVNLFEKGDDYPGEFGDILARARLTAGMARTVNGEPLAPPIPFDLGPSSLPVSPLDASVATAEDDLEPLCREVADPRPAGERVPMAQAGEHEALRRMLNRGKAPEARMDRILDVAEAGEGKLLVRYRPSPEWLRLHWQRDVSEANSGHSSIVLSPRHSQDVTAYDLAVAEPVPWSEEEKRFYDYVCEVADWRIKVPNPTDPADRPKVEYKLNPLRRNPFYADEDPAYKALIRDTAKYYARGKLPPQVDQAKRPEQLGLFIHDETTGRRAPLA